MPRGKKELAKQIIPKLREVEVGVGRGKTVLWAVKKIGVTEQTYYRWKKKFGGLRPSRLAAAFYLVGERIGHRPEHDARIGKDCLRGGAHAAKWAVRATGSASMLAAATTAPAAATKPRRETGSVSLAGVSLLDAARALFIERDSRTRRNAF